ncbi:hypothetical protein COO60DRAFT_140330 [Scenedesmus sp. NREL 46B-D3]|nr:hypothetical protein COO60DRAFT_140330 [Scenedesmus sp. NREL 46B-D3]
MSLAHHSTLRRAAFSSTKSRKLFVSCASARQHARSQPAQQQEQQHPQQQHTRRALLSQSAAAAAGVLLLRAPGASAAGPLDNIARQLTRPDITPLEAAVALLDARATLRDMAPLVQSAADSRERFQGRKLWPAYAKWLRPVGPSAPVAAAIIAGTDTEATLSSQYGGTGGSSTAADAVYVALGRVLTISGRTIRDEAQVDPQLTKGAEAAIDALVRKLPTDLVEQAQQYRVARASGKP